MRSCQLSDTMRSMSAQRILLFCCMGSAALYIIHSIMKSNTTIESETLVETGRNVPPPNNNVPSPNNNVPPPNNNLHERRYAGSAKKFLYTTMAPDCISDYLLQKHVLGDPEVCRCNILVASWKSKCNKPAPPHVRYIDGEKTTWGSGRNLVWDTVKAWNITNDYTYFIFMDDDLTWEYLNPELLGKDVKIDRSRFPLRHYEDFLLDQEPAVSTTWHNSGADPKGYPTRVFFDKKTMSPSAWPIMSVMITFDGCMSVFHRNAMVAFPYSTSSKSFYDSARYMHVKTYVLFRGHAVRYTPIVSRNGGHHPYPKGNRPWSQIIQTVQGEAPLKYQNNVFFNETYKLFGKRLTPELYVNPSEQPFPMLPKHHTVEAYAHLKGKS